MKSGNPKLTQGTQRLVMQIKNETLRDLILKGLHPSEVVDGWYYALTVEILKEQEGK